MHCYTHHEHQAVGVCKACQKAVCLDCVIDTGRGLACSPACEQEVKDINAIVDRSKTIYSIGKKNRLPQTGVLMFAFFGCMFTGIGIYHYLYKEYFDAVSIIMGLGFIAFAIFAYLRTRKLSLNY